MAKEIHCVEELSEKGFNEFIKPGVVVIDFFAEWCMPCLMMSPIVEELCLKMKKIRFGKINIDENSNLSSKFKVLSIPTLIVFKDGREIERLIGSLPADVLEEKLRKLVK